MYRQQLKRQTQLKLINIFKQIFHTNATCHRPIKPYSGIIFLAFSTQTGSLYCLGPKLGLHTPYIIYDIGSVCIHMPPMGAFFAIFFNNFSNVKNVFQFLNTYISLNLRILNGVLYLEIYILQLILINLKLTIITSSFVNLNYEIFVYTIFELEA